MYMKNEIAIVSFHNADNYGAVLQNYALQKAIESLGYLPVTIDFDDVNMKAEYKVKILPNNKMDFKELLRNIINFQRNLKHKSNFDAFRKKKLVLTESVSAEEISKLDGEYPVFITGSDQVWSSRIVQGKAVDVYTLGFVHKSRKCAYAASSGTSKNISNNILEKIKDIDYITVRENELKMFLNTEGIDDVKVVCDPVFLLTKKQWEDVMSRISINDENYTFFYDVGGNFHKTLEVAQYISSKKETKLYYPMKESLSTIFKGKSTYEDGPFEFISRIAMADTIVTSSFHAVAFSVLMEKQFIAILPSNTGSRVKDLLDVLGLSKRIVESKDDYLKHIEEFQEIDYRLVREKINDLRNYSMLQLQNICRK